MMRLRDKMRCGMCVCVVMLVMLVWLGVCCWVLVRVCWCTIHTPTTARTTTSCAMQMPPRPPHRIASSSLRGGPESRSIPNEPLGHVWTARIPFAFRRPRRGQAGRQAGRQGLRQEIDRDGSCAAPTPTDRVFCRGSDRATSQPCTRYRGRPPGAYDETCPSVPGRT